MKLKFKSAVAAMAVAASAVAYADNTQEKDCVETVGWTPVAVGLASPVQLPWGLAAWDVYGLDLGLFYTDAPKMYGLDVAGLASVTRCNLSGLQVSGLLNFGLVDVYGLRATIGLNLCKATVYGADLGLVGLREKLVGFDAEFIGSAQHAMTGVQVAGLANVVDGEACGCSLALGTNLARTVSGAQVALVFNMAEELHGAQIGLVNFVDYCPNGFQIGLVNIILSNQVKVLPIVNGCF
ncbi:MAG: hypothetical protein IKD42_01470 [Kiritimatiellae bacterium]|nr:hypothetical protein [Kiritimatiellia bacterium]